MDNHNKLNWAEISVDKIQRDPNQPRARTRIEAGSKRLLDSIKKRGILDPIKVIQIDDDRFQVIDGNRRLFCVQRLGFKTIPCNIMEYKKVDFAELEKDRFELQTNIMQWKPIERANVFNRIKTVKKFSSSREVAEFLGISQTAVANSMRLRDQNLDDLHLMELYDLSDTQRAEFIRLKPKLMKIKEFEVVDIIEVLFEKIKKNVIKNAKEFRKLSKIFRRASANEKEIYRFLTKSDMTIEELDRRTIRSGFSGQVEEMMKDVLERLQKGAQFQEKEIEQLSNFATILLNISQVKEKIKK